MIHCYVYGILFPKRDLEVGLFSLKNDLFEGETEENAVVMLNIICDKMEFDITKIKSYVFKKVSDNYFKELQDATSILRGPGNDGSVMPGESVGGTGDSGVSAG